VTNFLETALRNAARGFRIIPLRVNEKIPFLVGWPDLATTNEATIREWAAKWADINCGVAGGADIIILDTDRLDRLQEICGTDWEAWSKTFSVSSGRPNRLHLYYLATAEVLAWGNKRWKEQGHDGNVFEIKGRGAQVVAEGSVHPITGGKYRPTQDIPLVPFPPAMFHLLKDWWGKQNPSGKREWSLPVHDGEGRDDFLIQQAGRLRNVGASEAVIRAHLADLNSDPAVMADSKSEEDLDRIARSASRYDVPLPGNKVTFGKTAAPPEPAAVPERKRPDYPISIYDGTAAGEFAELCAADNNVPTKFYVESFLCCLGAVVGDRLSCPVEGALPRSFTIVIAPAGKGKGTSIRRAVNFFKSTWASSFTSLAPGLLNGAKDFIWKWRGIGAYNASASSGPGMVKLTLDLKKTLETSPQMSWGKTVPRILSVHEELKTLLSTLFIEGGTGTGMDGVICQLWDDTGFAAPGTDKRQAVYGEMQFSLLGAITEEDWFDLLSRGNVVGGGLMSRLNVIGTEGDYRNVPKMKPPDFTILQNSFLPRVVQLAETPCNIPPSEGADRVIAEWVKTLPECTVRMNVHVWRSALLLAWLRREEVITEKTAADAVLLGQYQVASQEYYRTAKIDNPYAAVQSKILRSLEMKGPATRRELQQRTNAGRVGTELWNRALDGLLKDGKVGKREDGEFYLAV
jgi:hypothetical protein